MLALETKICQTQMKRKKEIYEKLYNIRKTLLNHLVNLADELENDSYNKYI